MLFSYLKHSMLSTQEERATTTHTLPYPGLSFITFSHPTQSRLPFQKKAIRSHAASYQYRIDEAGHHASSTRKRGRKRKFDKPVLLEIQDLPQGYQSSLWPTPQAPSLLSILGGGRIDPFKTYPIPWEPFLPELIDHCRYFTSCATFFCAHFI